MYNLEALDHLAHFGRQGWRWESQCEVLLHRRDQPLLERAVRMVVGVLGQVTNDAVSNGDDLAFAAKSQKPPHAARTTAAVCHTRRAAVAISVITVISLRFSRFSLEPLDQLLGVVVETSRSGRTAVRRRHVQSSWDYQEVTRIMECLHAPTVSGEDLVRWARLPPPRSCPWHQNAPLGYCMDRFLDRKKSCLMKQTLPRARLNNRQFILACVRDACSLSSRPRSVFRRT